MSGLLRNILTFILSLLSRGTKAVEDLTHIAFLITPFDAGVRVLKSDKYFQLAECAQVDYLIKTGKFFTVVKSGAAFVNVAQIIRFIRPVPIFSIVHYETQFLYADEKCGYFSHVVRARGQVAAEILVKMKFKAGHLTVAPGTFLPVTFSAIPAKVLELEPALAALAPKR